MSLLNETPSFQQTPGRAEVPPGWAGLCAGGTASAGELDLRGSSVRTLPMTGTEAENRAHPTVTTQPVMGGERRGGHHCRHATEAHTEGGTERCREIEGRTE